MSVLQLDLFGEVEAAEEAAVIEAARLVEKEVRQAQENAEWETRFEVGVYRLRRGGWQVGYRCPDPWCSTVTSAGSLAHGHGYDPRRAGWSTHDGRCFVVRCQERTTHRLEDVRITEAGLFEARCWWGDALFYGASRAELQDQADEHREYVTQVKPPLEEWRRWPGR